MTRKAPQHLIDARNAAAMDRARHDLSASPIAPSTPSHSSPVALPPASFTRLPRRRPVITLTSLYAEKKAAGSSHLANAIFRIHRKMFNQQHPSFRGVPTWGDRFLRSRQQRRRSALAYATYLREKARWLERNPPKPFDPLASEDESEDESEAEPTQGESGYASDVIDYLYCPEPDSVEVLEVPSSEPDFDAAYGQRQLYTIEYDSNGMEIIVLDSDDEE